MKNKFTINKYGLRKMVAMVHPTLSQAEQMSTVENAWNIWKETVKGLEYDYFNLQFILWFWMSLNADADQLEKYAPRVSQEVQAAYWRAWGECQKARAIANEVVSEAVDKLLADAIEDLLGDTDGDPADNRVLMSMRPDQPDYIKCGDPDCPICNNSSLFTQEFDDA
jgi:hypothetical protein